MIPLLEAPGRVQMAIDRWLFQQHYLGLHPPVLRFYTWSPLAISLGYHQHSWPEHWQQLTWQGTPVELVRRPTGGRAVLHQGDLSYAVVVGMTGRRLQVYQSICEFLIQGWRSLGLELQYGLAGRGYIHNPSCFGTATGADLISTDGTKFIGSAQLRRGNTVLQHGSIRLAAPSPLFTEVFGEAESLSGNIRTNWVPIQTVVEALTTSACHCFDAGLEVQGLSVTEWQEILKIADHEISV